MRERERERRKKKERMIVTYKERKTGKGGGGARLSWRRKKNRRGEKKTTTRGAYLPCTVITAPARTTMSRCETLMFSIGTVVIMDHKLGAENRVS